MFMDVYGCLWYQPQIALKDGFDCHLVAAFMNLEFENTQLLKRASFGEAGHQVRHSI